MDKTLTAILVKATDKGESDKLVRLFTAEEGLVDATMRGVRKAKAKLKFAAQPFAVCVYELSVKSGRYTVTGATVTEDTYALCADPALLAIASVMAEITERSAASMDSGTLFLMLLKSLKALMLYPSGGHAILIKFTQKLLSLSGFIKPPKKTDCTPDTPARVLSFLAYKTLAEAAAESLDGATAKRAALSLLATYERVYETPLNTKKVYKELA